MAALTQEQVEKIQKSIDQTWQEIADDVFSSSGKSSMSKDDVVCVTLDADYLEVHGRLHKQTREEFKQLVDGFRKLTNDEQDEIARNTWRWQRTE